jgi:hypothetical protein
MSRILFSLAALTVVGLSAHTSVYAADIADDDTGSFVNEACAMPVTHETEEAQSDIDTYVKTLAPEDQAQVGKVTEMIEEKMKKPTIIAEETTVIEEPSALTPGDEGREEETEDLELAG